MRTSKSATGARKQGILAPWAELPRGGCPRGKQAFWKSETQLARRCVSIERGYQDALGCRAQQTEDEPVNNRDRAPNQKADNPADRDAAKEEQEARQREQEKDRPEAEVSAHGLAPRLPKERAAPLDRGPRSDLLEDQDRDDEIRDDAPGRTRESRDDAPDDPGTVRDRPQNQSHGRAEEGPTRDATEVRVRDFQPVRDRRVPAVQADHGSPHDGGVEVDGNEERDEVHDREARVEEHAPEGVRRVRDEEEDPEEEEDPRDAGREQGEEREEDEALFPPKDAQADLRQLPADAQPFEETELPRSRGKRPESGRRRDGRRRGPHRARSPIRSDLHQPIGGTPCSRRKDRVRSPIGTALVYIGSSQEKLLKRTANTRAPAAMKRSSRAWKKRGKMRWKWRKKRMRRRKREQKMRQR